MPLFELSGGPRTLLDMPALSEAADGDLLAMAGSEPEAFGELFRRDSRSVYAYCTRRTGNLDLAEDLTSVVFMEAFRRRRKLRLSNTSALPWLIGVANNVVRNADRSLRRYRSALDRIPVPANGRVPKRTRSHASEAQEALTRSLKAISALSKEKRSRPPRPLERAHLRQTRQRRSISRLAPSALVWPVPEPSSRIRPVTSSAITR